MFLSFLDKINNQYSKGLPFVSYRKPNEDEVKVIFQKDSELHFAMDYTESGFVFAPFDGDDPSILIQRDEAFVELFKLKSAVRKKLITTFEEDESGKDFHLEIIRKGISAIGSGLIKKVVLSRSFDVGTSKSPFDLFHDLLNQYPAAFCYIWFHPKIGLWLGATPEIFLELENNRFRTMSLAGTQLYMGEDAPVWGEKELVEQEMVTQFIKDSLQGKVTSLEVTKAKSTRAGSLWHIKSSVSGIIKNTGLKEIIRVLHPTPAVCGVPKILAKKLILKSENYNRQFYTGFLGELNFKEDSSRPTQRRNQENRAYRTIKNKTSLYVNLRCMQMLDNKLKVYVGGGITKESVPENEWQETKDKSKTMLNIILK